MKRIHQRKAIFLCGYLAFAGAVTGFASPITTPGTQPAPQAVSQSPDQLRELVAPIALYPDPLIGQILAAATYPAQVMEASKWMQQHHGLTGDVLAKEVDRQAWDPSVKALTQFPAVLANMSQNVAWTAELGDAYVNQRQELTLTIQKMRQLAKDAGNLSPTSEENVTSEGGTIDIEPVSTDEVYVPQYDPWSVYGASLPIFPGWSPYPGLYLYGPGIAFGLGCQIGWFGGYGWGWNHWGCDWHQGAVVYNHHPFVSRSRTIVDRSRANSVSHNFHSTRFAGQPASHLTHNLHRATARNTFTRSHSGAHAFFHSGGFHGGGFHGGGSHGGGFHGGGFHGGGFHGGGHGGHGRR